MESLPTTERVFTQLDYVRITRLMALDKRLAAGTMEAVLAEGELVASPRVPASVVTMYSQLLLEEAPGQAPRKLTLCYPDDAEPASGFISVFSPVGTALLGLRVGHEAHWLAPDGRLGRGLITDLLFQPESTGDYTT